MSPSSGLPHSHFVSLAWALAATLLHRGQSVEILENRELWGQIGFDALPRVIYHPVLVKLSSDSSFDPGGNVRCLTRVRAGPGR